MTLGEKIAYLRSEAHISQEALAERLGCSRQSVSKWELSEAIPGLEKIMMLGSIFGVSYDDLLSESADIQSRKVPSPMKTKGLLPGKYFGTDGFRGEVNINLTADQAFRVGRFIGWYYSERASYGRRAKILIGKDTRRSSYTLEYSIIAGITASGADAYMLHVTTTPSVSYIARTDGFDCGVMITASHNPYYDNGIKLINGNGEKADDELTALIELYLDEKLDTVGLGNTLPYASREGIGSIIDYMAGRNRYVGYLISLASHSFKKLRIGLDCANGAAWTIARSVFAALGAEIVAIGCEPDGLNINRGVGSTHIEALGALVKKNRLDVGFAFDGDADRCIAVDSFGKVIDGDKILYILAKRLKSRGALAGNKIAVTVMSNTGLVEALRSEGIECDITAVGDRFVYERMQERGYALGGEASGHIIMKKYATTGDGILTAIMLCEEICDKKARLDELTIGMRVYPMRLENVRVADRDAVMNDEEIIETAENAKREIGENGKFLLRKSGTEPLIRIMAECESDELCRGYIKEILDIIRRKGYACE